MEENFRGGRGRIGGLRGNKCKIDEKWDIKMNKCVKKTKNEMRNNYIIKLLLIFPLIIVSIFYKFWRLLFIIIFIIFLVIIFNYDSVINAFS
jgi:hypothetical protein